MLLSQNVWLELTLAVALAFSLVALVIAYASFLRLRRQATLTNKLYHQLEHDYKLITESTIGMGKKLIALEQAFLADEKPQRQPSEPQREAKTHRFLPGDDKLNDATLLLQAGVDSAEVARRCGISRAEASLLKLMRAHADTVSAA